MSGDVVPIPRRSPSRPQDRGEKRREAILEALENQLRTRSLDSVSIGRITEEAGLVRSAFYFYFASKQVAVTELLRERYADVTSGVDEILRGDGDHIERMSAALATVFRDWHSHRWLYLAVLDACSSDSEARSIWDRWLTSNEEFVAKYIDRERAANIAPDGLDSRVLAHALISLNERVIERHLRSDGDDAHALTMHATITHIWAASIYGVQAG